MICFAAALFWLRLRRIATHWDASVKIGANVPTLERHPSHFRVAPKHHRFTAGV
jgi:hypothetical protein